MKIQKFVLLATAALLVLNGQARADTDTVEQQASRDAYNAAYKKYFEAACARQGLTPADIQKAEATDPHFSGTATVPQSANSPQPATSPQPVATAPHLFATVQPPAPEIPPNEDTGLYVKVDGDFAAYTLSNTLNQKLYGGSLAFGGNFDESKIGYSSLDISVAGLTGSKTDGKYSTNFGTFPVSNVDTVLVPVLLNYNYHFKVSECATIYAGLSTGVTVVHQSGTIGFSGPSASFTGAALTYGGGIGVDFKISDSVGIDIGYRHAEMASFNANTTVLGTGVTVNMPHGHSDMVSAGVSFRF